MTNDDGTSPIPEEVPVGHKSIAQLECELDRLYVLGALAFVSIWAIPVILYFVIELLWWLATLVF